MCSCAQAAAHQANPFLLLLVCDASRVRAALADMGALSEHLQRVFAGSGTFTLGQVRDMLGAASVPLHVIDHVEHRLAKAPTKAGVASLPGAV
jgi:hypothetical protein